MKRSALAGAVLCLTVSVAQAQKPPPTPTDLRAAYCVEALKNLKGGMHTLNPQANPGTSQRELKQGAELTQQLRREINTEDAALQKLMLYVFARRADVDALALDEAARSADEDWNRITLAIAACSNNPKEKECETQTLPEMSAMLAKAKACIALDWLPT